MAYHIARNNQQLGQFDEGLVRQKLSEGEFLATDLCWTEGMADWQPLGQVVAAAAAAPPVMGEVNPYSPPTVQQTYRTESAVTGAPLATLGQRFGGALLDIVPILFVNFAFFTGLNSEGSALWDKVKDIDALVTVIAERYLQFLSGPWGVFVFVLLAWNMVWLTTRGQSIGKWLVNIRIVRLDSDDKPGFVKAVLIRGIVNWIIGAVPMFGGLYSLVDILFIFGKDRRCLHDLLAGTRVVQGQPEQA